MARHATYPAVVRITFAVEDTIRLKPDVVHRHALKQRKLIIATMTGRAKILREFIAAESTGIEN
jgi:hypothetical protein